LSIFPVDPDAGVRDSISISPSGLPFHRDTALGRSKFNAILNEVPKDLLQTRRISSDVRAFGAKAKFHFEMLAGDVFAANFAGPLEDFRHTNNLKA
jgi:hypothetical protein